MKRVVTIIICCVFLGYFLVLLSGIGFLRVTKAPMLGASISRARSFSTFGALFAQEASLNGFATSYRFYQNDKWQPIQKLEEASFEEYASTGRLASLKHNRLDKHLSQKFIGALGKYKGSSLRKNQDFKAFTAHLYFRHNGDKTPDSVELVFKRTVKRPVKKVGIWRFKFKP